MTPPSIPCVVQLGFAGARNLYSTPPANDAQRAEWNQLVVAHVQKSIGDFHSKLGLASQHFFCGISQIAIGADQVFAQALQNRHELHRVFLPELLENYLSAINSHGQPDFSDAEVQEVRSLLAASNICEVRVVTDATDRHDRFRHVNAEVLRVSDAIICLVRDDQTGGRAGGTNEMLARALATNRPVLEIRVSIKENKPVCENHWHVDRVLDFDMPSHPAVLGPLKVNVAGNKVPTMDDFREPLKQFGSSLSKRRRTFFVYSAAIVVLTHILATVFATAALALHGVLHDSHSTAATAELDDDQEGIDNGTADDADHADSDSAAYAWLIPTLLTAELLLLIGSYAIHYSLHRSHASRLWANARLIAEVGRSLQGIGPRHLYLGHIFSLSLPHQFRFLLRTLNVLHLHSTFSTRNAPWRPMRDTYIEKRVDGQIEFYERSLRHDRPRLWLCMTIFTIATAIAIIATTTKLTFTVLLHDAVSNQHLWATLLGTTAVLMPVLAVASLSWAGALDYDARVETFAEAREHLVRQRAKLLVADTATEYDQLIAETETKLLGEVANWYSRRANTGI